MQRRIFLSLVLLTLLAPSALLAQLTTGDIVGTVRDDTGAVLPGVTVTLTGANVAGSRLYVTTERGAYRFLYLPPGDYTLKFELPGFATRALEQIAVSVGDVREINVVLQVGLEMTETVTVIGENPVVDVRSNTFDTNYDRDWVENSPTRRFVFFDYLNAAPGVSQASYGSSRSSVMGSGGDENTYQMDGTDITTPVNGVSWPWPNTDAIEEVEIVSLGAPAEYSNATGAVFNIVTRQGTNEFHGDANFYFQSQGLTGRNTTEEEDDGLPYNRDEFTDVTGQLGGPIVKDKLWFFAGFQYQKDSDSQPGVDPNFPSTAEYTRFNGKFNYQINHENKVSGMFHRDYFYIPWGLDANSSPETQGVEVGATPTANITYTGIVSDNTVLEGSFSGFWGDNHHEPILEGQPSVGTRFYDLDTGEITGATYGWYDADYFKTAFNAKVTHYAEDFLGGNHDFKFGVQYQRGGANGNINYNDFIFTYEYYGYEYAYGYRYDNYAYSGVSQELGLFFDDSFQVNDSLTINFGVRYDNRRAIVEEFPILDEDRNPLGGSITPIDNLYTWNPVSPRIGFSLKLTDDGRSVLKGHYGRYYRPIITCEYCVAIGSTPHEFLFGFYDLENGQFFDLEPFEMIPANSSISPDYENPRTDQFIVAFEQDFGNDFAVQFNYAHKRGRGYAAWRDIRGVYEDTVYIDDQGAGATGAAIPVQRLLSDPADRFFELDNDDRMNTDIHAFTVQMTKRMSDNWQLNSSFSFLRTDGILPSGRSGPTSGQSTALAWDDFGQNPNDFVNAGGRLPGERPWMFKTQLLYMFPADFLVSVNYVLQSGKAWPRTIRVDDLGLRTEINAEERDGSRRVDDWNLLDVRVQKAFALGPDARLGFFLDALNLFNNDANENVLSRLGTSSSFGLRSQFLPPRRVMLGVKFMF